MLITPSYGEFDSSSVPAHTLVAYFSYIFFTFLGLYSSCVYYGFYTCLCPYNEPVTVTPSTCTHATRKMMKRVQ
jgi:hypothetical protein